MSDTISAQRGRTIGGSASRQTSRPKMEASPRRRRARSGARSHAAATSLKASKGRWQSIFADAIILTGASEDDVTILDEVDLEIAVADDRRIVRCEDRNGRLDLSPFIGLRVGREVREAMKTSPGLIPPGSLAHWLLEELPPLSFLGRGTLFLDKRPRCPPDPKRRGGEAAQDGRGPVHQLSPGIPVIDA